MRVTFGEIVEFAIGGGWGHEEPSAGTVPVRVIRGADFPAAESRDLGSAPLRYEPAKKAATRVLREGDIVLEVSGGTKDRPTGRSVYVSRQLLTSVEDDVIPASFCRLVRIDRTRAWPGYVYYALQDLYARGGTWEFQNQSTGISNFQFEMFRECWQLNLPPYPEQQAISEVLGALDDKIAANTALAATVDTYLAALLDEMASGCDATTLGAIADVNRRSVKPVPDGRLRYIDIASVAAGSFEYPDSSRWAEAPGRARRGLSSGDTMWSTVRPNRRSHALNLEDDPLLVASTGLAILSPREVGFAYLYEASRRLEFSAFLENVAEGSAYPAVRADRFLDAPIPDLPADRIAAFEGQAAPLRELAASQARENRTLAATRDALLPQLISGKLRVRDAEAAVSAAGA